MRFGRVILETLCGGVVDIAACPNLLALNRRSALNVWLSPHSRRRAEGSRRSAHDPKPTSEAAENEARNGKFCPIRDVRVDE
jgi:hypothetical protein